MCYRSLVYSKHVAMGLVLQIKKRKEKKNIYNNLFVYYFIYFFVYMLVLSQ